MGNKEIIRKLFDRGWRDQDFEEIEDLISDHATFHVREATSTMDFEITKRVISRWKESFPDLEFEVVSMIEEDNMVAAHMVMTGTHLGVFRDIEPTGKEIRVPHMFFFRLEEGKLVTIWEVNDFSETIKMLKGR